MLWKQTRDYNDWRCWVTRSAAAGPTLNMCYPLSGAHSQLRLLRASWLTPWIVDCRWYLNMVCSASVACWSGRWEFDSTNKGLRCLVLGDCGQEQGGSADLVPVAQFLSNKIFLTNLFISYRKIWNISPMLTIYLTFSNHFSWLYLHSDKWFWFTSNAFLSITGAVKKSKIFLERFTDLFYRFLPIFIPQPYWKLLVKKPQQATSS